MFIGDYNPRLDMLGWTRLCIQGLSKRGSWDITTHIHYRPTWQLRMEGKKKVKRVESGKMEKGKPIIILLPFEFIYFSNCLQCLLMSCLIKTLFQYILSEFGAEGQLVDELQDCIRKWGLRMTSSSLSWDICSSPSSEGSEITPWIMSWLYNAPWVSQCWTCPTVRK